MAKTIRDIKLDEFEAWKSEMRMILKDDKYNTIKMSLDMLDNASSDKEFHDSVLLDFYHCSLAYRGELHCTTCGWHLSVYYNVICYKCDKPQIQNDGTVNYVVAMNWLHANDISFDDNEFRSILIDRGYMLSNDSVMHLPEPVDIDDAFNNSLRILNKHFDTHKWYVSW